LLSRVDAACRRALDIGDPTYRTVKGTLAAGTETDHQPARPASTVNRPGFTGGLVA
jgi:hypothetical protein